MERKKAPKAKHILGFWRNQTKEVLIRKRHKLPYVGEYLFDTPESFSQPPTGLYLCHKLTELLPLNAKHYENVFEW